MARVRRCASNKIVVTILKDTSHLINLYRVVVQFATPFLKSYLRYRLKHGKEDPTRLHERFGGASLLRPPGKLLWFHGASVGESLSILKLLYRIKELFPQLSILVTTGTVTSAQLMAQKLPKGIIHQYIPLDVDRWTGRFLDQWKPDLAIILESELWPNLLMQIKKHQIPLILLNARLSDRSYGRWIRFPTMAKSLLGLFDLCLTPSTRTAERLQKLGAKEVKPMVNLKFTSAPLLYDHDKALLLKEIIGSRPSWVAASTHPGEEEIVLETHTHLKHKIPHVLTILAPRHPHRADSVIKLIEQKGLKVARLSQNTSPHPNIDIWLIDTIGDMGLVYHLADIAFMGGSLVPIGGHNPIEAMQHGAVVIHGPYDANAKDIHDVVKETTISISDAAELAPQVLKLMKDTQKRQILIEKGYQILQQQESGLDTIINNLVKDIIP